MDNIELLKDKIESLRIKIDQLNDENRNLREELRNTESHLRSAKFRISEELEPRIERDNRGYDVWVTSPNRADGEQ